MSGRRSHTEEAVAKGAEAAASCRAASSCQSTAEAAGPDCLSPAEAAGLFRLLKEKMGIPKPELVAPTPFCFLVSVVLSAQATDKSVNAATGPLYERVSTPAQMLALGEEGLIPYIRSIGLYNAKAKHIIELSRQLIEKFGGELPSTREELMTPLPFVIAATVRRQWNIQRISWMR